MKDYKNQIGDGKLPNIMEKAKSKGKIWFCSITKSYDTDDERITCEEDAKEMFIRDISYSNFDIDIEEDNL